jgi:tRNA pseudouridine55 synthase
MNGAVLIDKPAGCTSHDVVNRWRKLAGTRRVGHLGTLDPMATGLLVLLTGTATRLAQFFDDDRKTYHAEITLGLISDTYDAEGHKEATGIAIPPAATIAEGLRTFEGEHLQVPPPVSAKKVNGVRAYKLARQNVPVTLAPVLTRVHDLRIDSIEGEHVRITVTCSAGTYIRSIAHDLGRLLGCGALLSGLRRSRAGEWSVDDARTLDQLSEFAQQDRLGETITPSAELLSSFGRQYVTVGEEAAIRQGRDFRTSPFTVIPGSPHVKAVSHSGELIAIGKLVLPNVYHPTVVL